MGECGRGEERIKGELQRGQEESRASRTSGRMVQGTGERGKGHVEGRDEAVEGSWRKQVGAPRADGVEERGE